MGVELAPGTVLRSRYVLEDVIGRGGTSIVYRAKDLHRALSEDMATKFVAIKMLRPEQCANPLALRRLKREFQQMQGLTHPGIVRVFDLDRDSDIWFMSMELVAGQTVKTWMETPYGHADALRIINACCEALKHAHSLGILHGDLKPTNVLVSDDGTAKLMDFGSAPSPGSPVAAGSEPTLAATPLYASPQILAGQSPELRDDVYSLACLSYNIFSGGRHPFAGRASLKDDRAPSTSTYVPAVPAGLLAVIERGLSAERERRPPSVREFLDDLNAADGARTRIESTALVPIAHRIDAGRASYQRVRPPVRLIALVSAIVGTTVSYPFGTHREVIRVPESTPVALIASPEPLTTTAAQSEVVPEPRPLLHDTGVISFDASTIRASAAQSLVAISVKRLPATSRRGAFFWRVERGTARPGVDYQQMEPQVDRFIEGQAVRTLFVPLINTSATSEQRGPRTFTVALERVRGGPALGRFASVTVAIDPQPASSPPN
jgi:serine/threonine protein kinase